jgi:hypothetical protein
MNSDSTMGRLFVPTAPGTTTAREHGCTCPAEPARPTADGGMAWTRDPACPLHTSDGLEARRDRQERAARAPRDNGRFVRSQA